MNENNMYYDFGLSIMNKLRDKVRGKIVFEAYKEIDAVIFKVYFKDFNFKYVVKNVTNLVLTGGSDIVVEEILKKYREVVMKAFFKGENKF